MKFAKGLLRFGTPLLLIGLVLTIGFLLLGGNIEEALGSGSISYDRTIRNAEGVEVSLPFGQVSFEKGDQFQIQCQNIPREFIMSKTTTDGIWTITVQSDGSFSERMKYLSLVGIPKVMITVPQDTAASSISVHIGAGRADIYDITAKNIRGDIKLGYLNVTNFISLHTDLKCDVGALVLAGKTSGYNRFNCHIGAIAAYLIGDTSQSKIEASNTLGLLKVDDSAMSGFRNNVNLNSNGDDRYLVKNLIGFVRLKFYSLEDAAAKAGLDLSGLNSLDS